MTAAEEWTPQGGNEGSPEPEFEPILPPRQKKRWGLRIGIPALVILAVGAGAAWYKWGGQLFLDPDADIPMVRAEDGPIKVRPESPGGMEVPDRDMLVYDRLDGNGERPAVERLLPTPEAPMELPEPPAPEAPVAQVPAERPRVGMPEAPASKASQQDPYVAAAPEAQTPAPPAPAGDSAPRSRDQAETPLPPPMPETTAPTVAEVLTAMRPPPAPQPAEPESESMAPAPEQPPAAPAPAKAAAASAAGGYKVQLAAVRERGAVDSEWSRLSRRHSDLLGALELSVMRADLGPAKGVFFRLRAGPIADEAEAKALCKALSERKVGCLVVRPEE